MTRLADKMINRYLVEKKVDGLDVFQKGKDVIMKYGGRTFTVKNWTIDGMADEWSPQDFEKLSADEDNTSLTNKFYDVFEKWLDKNGYM